MRTQLWVGGVALAATAHAQAASCKTVCANLKKACPIMSMGVWTPMP